MNDDSNFKISVVFPDELQVLIMDVKHTDETFEVRWADQAIAIFNNGDNSWSLVTGELSQFKVNTIGQAVEDFYQRAGW